MSKNPFKDYQEFVSKPKRNSFDMSFRNNLTLRFGDLVPVFCKEVYSGDSMKLDSKMGFNFMPMVFPIQTPMRASMYYFYVRNRNLWDNWKDFIFQNKTDVVHPFIDQSNPDFFKTGSLADYLGVPSTFVSTESASRSFVLRSRHKHVVEGQEDSVPSYLVDSGSKPPTYASSAISYYSRAVADFWLIQGDSTRPNSFLGLTHRGMNIDRAFTIPSWVSRDRLTCRLQPATGETNVALVFTLSVPDEMIPISDLTPFDLSLRVFFGDEDESMQICGCTSLHATRVDQVGTHQFSLLYLIDSNITGKINSCLSEFGPLTFCFGFPGFAGHLNSFYLLNTYSLDVEASEPIDASAITDAKHHPFISSDKNPSLRINALPFRAYEAIYNSYFRNERVEPFMIDGVVEYNKFNTTTADGADDTPYHLFQRNWEYDFLTSALPSPQQGAAPIVGADLRSIKFLADDGESIVNFAWEAGQDGETIVGGHFTDGSTPAARRAAMDIVSAGFTINDLRDAGAMQRWLERNIRRGLRYKDQIKSHTGVDVRYDELDMPEFLGGYSRSVDVSQITQAAGNSEMPLGDYAGQASIFAGSKHSVSRYFDEDGWVIGILCVTPQPAYSQLLPKHFLHSVALDYYNNEFSHIGMQPITYAEVCPLQAKNSDKELSDVFGYQRPWYHLVANVDEVHGLMRTNMRNFVMNRTFDNAPELGASFLHVDPAQLNQVFQVTQETDHVIMGQVAFQCYMKRPIPRVGEPRFDA